MNEKRWSGYADYLARKGKTPEIIYLVREQLSSILETVHAPEFVLAPDTSLDDTDIIRAITLMTGQEVRELNKVSFKKFASATHSIPGKSHQALLKSLLVQNVGRRFRTWVENPQQGLGAAFFNITDPNRHSSIVHDNDEAIERLGFDDAMRGRLHLSFGQKLGNEIDRGLWALLRFYTVFVLADHAQGRDITAIGLDLCSQVFPVGSLDARPKAWRILVA